MAMIISLAVMWKTMIWAGDSLIVAADQSSSGILTWHRGYRDPEGGAPRVRPFHCTQVGLTLAIAPNVGDSGA